MKRLLVAFCSALGLIAAGSCQAENFFTSEVDPMTDAVRGFAVVNKGGSITAVFKCDSNGPNSLYFSLLSKDYLGSGSDENRTVKFRFDGNTPIDVRAHHNGKAASFLDPRNTSQRNLINQFRQAKKVAIQVTDYEYRSYTDAFDLGDASAVIEQAITTCKDTTYAKSDQ